MFTPWVCGVFLPLLCLYYSMLGASCQAFFLFFFGSSCRPPSRALGLRIISAAWSTFISRTTGLRAVGSLGRSLFPLLLVGLTDSRGSHTIWLSALPYLPSPFVTLSYHTLGGLSRVFFNFFSFFLRGEPSRWQAFRHTSSVASHDHPSASPLSVS